jgi:hypothetical protein
VKIYRGHSPVRTGQGVFLVTVSEGRQNKILSPGPSQKLYNHSPDGFNWGFSGSGPAQLALALLLDVTGDRDIALSHHQNFKWQVVASWAQDQPWQYSEEQIRSWLKLHPE